MGSWTVLTSALSTTVRPSHSIRWTCDLAPALLSAADLFQSLNRLIHPTDREVQVNIMATEQGSFLVQLKILYDTYVSLGTNPGVVATEGLAGLVAVVVGMIRFLAKRGGSGARQPQRQRFPMEWSL